MRLLTQCLAIGAAGFCGALLRFFVARGCGRLFGPSFPVGTFLINITGSLFLGWFLTRAAERTLISETTRLAIATGFVGAYTTFSTLTYESNLLIDEGSNIKAAINLLGSLLLGLLAVRLGVALARRF
jgi:fluoride exporter